MKSRCLATAVFGAVLVIATASSMARADGPNLVPYGFIRFDAIFDDSRMSHPQFPAWVTSETEDTENDRELSLHPRLTRFGVKVSPTT